MPHPSAVTGLSHHPYHSSHPSNARLDLNIASRDNLSSFTQRVMSAKLLRLKQLQNQLTEAHLQLNELCTENRLLRALQKRQDLALDRYEGTQAQLPQLVRSHQEEVRVLRTKYKNLKHQYRTVTNSLKERETELQNLKEQHAHLLKLSKDRSLGEREALSKQVNELKATVDNQASTIQVLNRKILLETKNLRFQLQQEMQRHKTTQSELQQSYSKLDELQSQLDLVKERNSLPSSMDRLGKTSSLRFTGNQNLIRMTSDRNQTQIPKLKKVGKDCEVPTTSNNTAPSSVQFDNSSSAISSGKTNESSTSFDSSPEHTSDKADDITSTAAVSDSYQLHRAILQKGGKDFNISFDATKNKRISGASKVAGCLSADVLEKEYENAVAMLTELSTKHNGSFIDDLSSSLVPLDLNSAKQVAVIANSSFSLKENLQPALSAKSQQVEYSTNGQSSQRVKDVSESFKMSQPPAFEPQKSAKLNCRPQSSTVSSLSDSLNPTSETDSYLGTSKPQGKATEDIIPKNKSVVQKKESFLETSSPLDTRNNEDEIGTSQKEALLQALKAIDDNASGKNVSDNEESSISKISSQSIIIPSRRFSTGVNSSNISFGLNSRRQSFK